MIFQCFFLGEVSKGVSTDYLIDLVSELLSVK